MGAALKPRIARRENEKENRRGRWVLHPFALFAKGWAGGGVIQAAGVCIFNFADPGALITTNPASP
jgi:hypothetical protein